MRCVLYVGGHILCIRLYCFFFLCRCIRTHAVHTKSQKKIQVRVPFNVYLCDRMPFTAFVYVSVRQALCSDLHLHFSFGYITRKNRMCCVLYISLDELYRRAYIALHIDVIYLVFFTLFFYYVFDHRLFF